MKRVVLAGAVVLAAALVAWLLPGSRVPRPRDVPPGEREGAKGRATLAAPPGGRGVAVRDARVTVRGHVRGVDDVPCPGALVTAGGAHTHSDEEGAFVLSVSAGTLSLAASTTDGRRGTLTEDTTEDAELRVTVFEVRPLEGTVKDAAGRPVAGAQVTAVAHGFGRSSARTGADGAYRLEEVPAACEFRLDVEAGDHGRTAREELIWAPNARVDVVLPATRTLRGRVVRVADDGTRVGVGGVRVQFTYGVGGTRHGICWDGVAVDGPGTVTLPDGTFVCAGITRGDAVRLVTREYVPPPDDVDWPDAGLAEFVVTDRAEPGERLRAEGRVVDAAGRASVGARVTGGGAASWTDAEGRFVLDGAMPDVPGGITFEAECGDEAGTLVASAQVLRRGERLTLTTSRRPALAGIVVDEEGTPIEGADVCLDRRSDGVDYREANATTDAAGRYRFRRLATQTMRLGARAVGFVSGELDAVLPSTPETTVPPLVLARKPRRPGRVLTEAGEAVTTLLTEVGCIERLSDGRYVIVGERARLRAPGYLAQDFAPPAEDGGAEWVFVMRRPRIISGRVLDLEGRPAVGVDVGLRGPAGGSGPLYSTLWDDYRTDIAGGFRIAVPYDGRYRVRLRARGSLFPLDTTALADGPPVTVQAVRPRRLPGRLVGPDGRGLASITIAAGLRDEAASHVTDTTDGEGRFCFEDLVPPRVAVWAPDPLPDHLILVGAEDVPADGRELVLRAEVGRTIEGRVLRPDGTPASGAEIEVGRAGACTDAQGWFRVEGLAPGAHEVRVSDFAGREGAPVFGARLVGVPAGTRDAVIRLEPVPPEEESDD